MIRLERGHCVTLDLKRFKRFHGVQRENILFCQRIAPLHVSYPLERRIRTVEVQRSHLFAHKIREAFRQAHLNVLRIEVILVRVGDETGFYRDKIDIVAQGVNESVGAKVEKQSVIDYRLGAGADVSAARRL